MLRKDWDKHVVQAEEVARTPGFRELRDVILELAGPRSGDRVLDLGAGTGLLTLSVAPRAERVWSLDISGAMCEYLRAKAASAGAENVQTIHGSAVSVPLMDASVELVVSNYCFHHLTRQEKERALGEVERVLVPGGRFVMGDMMFGVGLGRARDRQVIGRKALAMLAKGPAGLLRLLTNAVRVTFGRGERPARADWWETALADTGFVGVSVRPMAHEGGVATARKRALPSESSLAATSSASA